jgi:carboxypeptidase family protein
MRFAGLLLWLAVGAFAQDGATVQGTVANSATHTGLGGVAVTLWTQQGVHYNATTDDNGAYQISGMKPGRYFSRFEKNGFVEVPHEGPSANSPLPVGAGGTPIRLDTELVPLATVRGRVVDPEGRPAADVEVGLDRFNTVTTGADGQFVLHDQRPGSYTLLARPKATRAVTREQQRTEIVPTFYPSAADRAQAGAVVVRGGDDLSGFEIRLRTSVVYRVRGVVLQPDGKPLARADVRLLSLSHQPGLGGQMTFGAGAWDIMSVHHGRRRRRKKRW